MSIKRLTIVIAMFSFFKSNSQELFFGQYQKPDLLLKLEEFQANSLSWEHLGFYIEYDHHYSMTPLDVIPFAGTGGDGIHFGFLTDFGTIEDLNNSPIVCVSPSNDPPVKLVANNLSDFLSIVVVIGVAEFLDEDYESEEEIESRLTEWDEISEVDWRGNKLSDSELKNARESLQVTLNARSKLRETLANEFGIQPMKNIFNYIVEIREKRLSESNVNDYYDLGIIKKCSSSGVSSYDFNNKEPQNINKYLDGANECERLLFYRNSTYQYILSNDYDVEIKRLLVDRLKDDGYIRESRLLAKKY